MSKKLPKYIVTTGAFDNQTNSLKEARKQLKKHFYEMRERFPNDDDSYGIYMLVERKE